MYQVNSLHISIILLLFFSIPAQAQDFSFEHNNRYSIESLKHNAAFIPNDNFYLQSSFSTFINSNNLSINSIFNKQQNQISTIINLLNDSNLNQLNLNSSINIDVFNLGFKLKSKYYFSFNSSMQFIQQLNLDKNIPGLIYLGNADTHYFGRHINIDFNHNELKILNQNRFSLAYRASDKLTIGAGVSIINALYRIKTHSSSFEVISKFNDSSIYEIQNKANIYIETNGFNRFNSVINPIDLLFLQKPSNLSAVFDLGGIFRLNQYFRFSASVKNIGKINWSNNHLIHHIRSNQIQFTGLQLPIQYNGFETIIRDSLFEWYDYDAYSSNLTSNEKLNTDFNLSIEFFANSNHVFQYLFNSSNSYYKIPPVHSLAYKFDFNHTIWGSISVSSNPINHWKPIYSMGLGIRLGPLQIQSSIYNVLAISQTESLFKLGANVGVSLVLGRQSDKDGDGVIDSKDKCPRRFGNSNNQGCPQFYKFKNHIILE